MRTCTVSVVLAGTMMLSGCGATRRITSTVAPGPTLTAATITFVDPSENERVNPVAR